MPASVEERGATPALKRTCHCEACKKGRGEASKIYHSDVCSYSARPPGGWQKKAASSESNPKVFLGVELETDINDQPQRERAQANRVFPAPRRIAYPLSEAYYTATDLNNDQRYWYTQVLSAAGILRDRFALTSEEAASLAEPRDFWIAKHDGSVSGPEFASQPATLNRWYELRPTLEQMFTNLLHGAVRSYEGDHAGMHINISSESFRGSRHLERFAKLVNYNAEWAQEMAQRTNNSMSWCRLGTRIFAPGQESQYALSRWATEVARIGRSSRAGDRYVAINTECGGGRIEFRLPRGTLRADRFYKNLEWVAAMIEFTGLFENTNADDFMAWVMMDRSKYSDLRNYLRYKFGATAPSEYTFTTAHDHGTPMINSDDADYDYREDDDPYYDDEYTHDEWCECDECLLEEQEREQEDSRLCFCGATHDLPTGYLPWESSYGAPHSDPGGFAIGPARVVLPDGSSPDYDEYGRVIIDPDNADDPLAVALNRTMVIWSHPSLRDDMLRSVIIEPELT